MGIANEPKPESIAVQAITFLQPYVQEAILSPPSRSEVNDERKSVLQIESAERLVPAFTENVTARKESLDSNFRASIAALVDDLRKLVEQPQLPCSKEF